MWHYLASATSRPAAGNSGFVSGRIYRWRHDIKAPQSEEKQGRPPSPTGQAVRVNWRGPEKARVAALLAICITELDLTAGLAAASDVRIRQAVAADLGSVAELVALAGVRLEDTLADAVTAGNAGGALRAGQEAFVRHLAEQFIAHPEEPLHAYLSAALILVAEHQEHGIIGALIAYPSSNVALDHLRQARRKDHQQS
jgi:hypothetical protein